MRNRTANRPLRAALMGALSIFVFATASDCWAAAATQSSTKPTTQPTAPHHEPSHKPSAASELADLSLEQLMQVEVSTDTLTKTNRSLIPAAVTTIDRPMIDQANPRSLTALLNVYVPNFESDPSQ